MRPAFSNEGMTQGYTVVEKTNVRSERTDRAVLKRNVRKDRISQRDVLIY